MTSTDRELKTGERGAGTPLSRQIKVLRRIVSSGPRHPTADEVGEHDFPAVAAAQAKGLDELLNRLDEDYGPVSDEIKRQVRAGD